MGLLDKIKNAVSSNSNESEDTENVETTNDDTNNTTDESIDIAVKVEKTDNCCGGNCGG